MVWREQVNHVDNCYFCVTDVAGFSSKSKVNIKYPNLLSSIRPIPHSADLPSPLFTSLLELVDEPISSTSEESSLKDDCYEALDDNKSPISITQAFFNDLVRDLNLQKNLQKFLGPGYNTTTFLLPTQHIPGTSKEEKIWYNIFHRGNICVLLQCCGPPSSDGLYI